MTDQSNALENSKIQELKFSLAIYAPARIFSN
jgi:hypothetical protein